MQRRLFIMVTWFIVHSGCSDFVEYLSRLEISTAWWNSSSISYQHCRLQFFVSLCRTLIYPGTSSGNFEAFSSPDGHSTLLLRNAQVQDSGRVIICSTVNVAGSASTRTRLTVTSKEDRPPPVIIRGPVNQTLPISSVAVQVCEASGSYGDHENYSFENTCFCSALPIGLLLF